jgi:hypothetical protein
VVWLAASCGLSTAWAQADPQADRLNLTLGVKTWSNSWDSWVTSRTGTGVALGTQRYQIVQAVSSGVRTSVTPYASLRHGRFFESVSMMQRTDYSLQDAGTPGGFVVRASRREADFNSGYSVLPNVAVTAGYKQLTQTYGQDRYRWAGPLVGVSGNASIAPGWSLYGSAGLGSLRANLPDSQKDSAGNTRFRATYRLTEFGIAHGLPGGGGFLRSIALTIGYRSQTVVTRGYGLAVTDPGGGFVGNTYGKLVDTTQGLALSIGFAF